MNATPTTTASHLDTITEQLAQATAQLEAWKAIREKAIEQLQALHDAGHAPTKFTAHGYTFGLQTGKTSTVFDAHGKAEIEALRHQLIDQGHCTESQGKPFWVLRKAKTAKAAA